MEKLLSMLREKTQDPEGDFPSGLVFEANGPKKRYFLNFEYRKKKKDGSFTQKKYDLPVLIKYDPFTGEKL